MSTIGSFHAQKGKVSSAIKKYNKLEYATSRTTLLDLASKENAEPEVFEKLANTFYFNSEMEEAAKWYEELFKKAVDINPENYFRYAHALKAQKKYNEADKALSTFVSLKPEDTRSKSILRNQNYLRDIEKVSQEYTLNNLNINTTFSDFGTSLFNGKLIFASSRDEDENIYKWNAQPFLDIFEFDENGNIQEIKGAINTKYHESSTAFTKDGSTMYFTRNNFYKGKFRKNSDNTHALKIYKATLVDGKWDNIESLPFNSDEYSTAHPALSPDEKQLYFTSDMPGTKGMSDIFVVNVNEDDTYSEPVNLGGAINTAGRENFPFISADNILYFASNGHVGLGGLDIFKVDLNSLTDVPQNLGKPINSSKDDFAYIIDISNKSGYISSNREGGKGDDDIYSFEIPECGYDVTGIVLDKNTNKILPNAKVILKDTDNTELQYVVSNNKGEFSFNLKCKEVTYIVEATKDEYEDDFTDFKVDVKSDETLNLKLALKPIAASVGTDLAVLLNLEPIYFDYDKSYIRPDAEIELAKVIRYMKEYPNVKVDVRSHTDSRGRDAYNLALSERRNASTKAYIIDKGKINSNRISGKGYGETQLTNRCSNGVKCTKEEHQANRRSEFIVVEN